MSAAMGVVHVRPAGAGLTLVSGREVERHERKSREWRARGYRTGAAPVDGRDHPYDKPCPACSEGG